jgi:hypothetical protein
LIPAAIAPYVGTDILGSNQTEFEPRPEDSRAPIPEQSENLPEIPEISAVASRRCGVRMTATATAIYSHQYLKLGDRD